MKKKAAKKIIKSEKIKLLTGPEPVQNAPLITGGKVDLDPQVMIMTAISQGASLDIVERLLSMREKLKAEAAEEAFRESMAAFQAECPVIEKKRTVNSEKSALTYKYASLDDIVKAVKTLISNHGFSYKTETRFIENPPAIEAIVTVTHALGHSEKSSFTVPIAKSQYISDQQTFGVAQTFAQRYAFRNAFGILTGDQDTDGRGAKQSEDIKIEEENQARIKEANDKYSKFKQETKDGFKHLGYTPKNILAFCERFSWDEKLIYKKINEIADAGNAEKIKDL